MTRWDSLLGESLVERQVTNDSKVGLVENAGGWTMDDNAACAVTILKK